MDRGPLTETMVLTAYFAERERSGDRFLADAMLELFAAHEVATSVMLRGIASFGPRHHIRSDQSLSLSEDLPVVIAGVDTAARIADLVDEVTGLISRGLMTLERSRPDLPAEPVFDESDAVKLRVFVGRRQRLSGMPAHQFVCDIAYRHGFAAAGAFLGVDGTTGGRRRRARFFSGNVDVPVMVVAIGTHAQARKALETLASWPAELLTTVERIKVCKRDGRMFARPHELPATDASGLPLYQKLTVTTSEADRHEGKPVHRALIRRLRRAPQANGATVLRGIWGFHDDGPPHGDRALQLVRHVPVTTVIVDTPESVAASFDIVDELTAEHGLVTSEMVPAMIAKDGPGPGGGTRIARHHY